METLDEKDRAIGPKNSSYREADKPMWLEVVGTIAIPLAIAVLTGVQIWIAQENRMADLDNSKKNRENEEKISHNNLQHEIMAKYLEDMKGLIFEKRLLESPENAKVESVARAITLNTARQLDPIRKGQLLKFLYEADLVGHCQLDEKGQVNGCKDSVVSLEGIRFNEITFEAPTIPLPRVDLQGASLANAELSGITLKRAEMFKADLTAANLTGADLTDAQMKNTILAKATLFGAFLTRANLEGSNLRESDLQKANLQKADLRGADLTGADLQGTNFSGAKYSPKTIFPSGFNPTGKGMQLCPPSDLTDLNKQCFPS